MLNTLQAATTRAAPRRTCEAVPCVFVVNEDEAQRESLGNVFDLAGWDARAFNSTAEFLAHPPLEVPTCLVLEVSLPGMEALAVQAAKDGAVELLAQPVSEAALVAAVQRALDASCEHLHARAEGEVLRARYASLTPRQIDVMALVVAGRLNKQTADELGLSVITVKAHRGAMMRKMGVRSVADLVKMAARLGLGD